MLQIKSIFNTTNISTKIFQLLVAVFIFTALCIFISTVFISKELNEINTLKINQLFQQIGMFILPPIALTTLWSKKPFAYLQLNEHIKWLHFVILLLLMVICIPFINLLTSLNQQLILPDFLASIEDWMKTTELEATKLTEKMLQVSTVNELFFNILIIAVLPAIGEELFFRGTIQKIISEKYKKIWAIWITAFIFSAIHLQFYGFAPRLLMGAFFGYLLYWSKNLWLPIFAHFINNFFAVVFFYLKFNGYKVVDMDTIGSKNTTWIGIISGIGTIMLIILIKKSMQNRYYQKNQ